MFLVLPNAFREFKLPFLLLLLIISLSNTKIPKSHLIYFWQLITVCLIYILVGANKTVDFENASSQAIVVYAVFPILWIILGNFIFNNFSYATILKKYIQIGLWGCVSVYLSYAAFKMGYGDYVKILVENPNAVYTGNVYAITLNVFGSLIFISAAIGHASKLYPISKYVVILLIYIITAAISGRSALILAAAIGIYGLIISEKKFFKKSIIILIGFMLITVTLTYFNLELKGSIEYFVQELLSGGGDERTRQTSMLAKGILDTFFLGAGHGVGIEYIRNYDYPWRYENLIFSLVYRTGIVGFLVYFYPFFYSILSFFKIRKMKILNIYDRFFLWGMVVFVMTNFTNPYLESFEFQIPYFFTYCYFSHRMKNKTNENLNIT